LVDRFFLCEEGNERKSKSETIVFIQPGMPNILDNIDFILPMGMVVLCELRIPNQVRQTGADALVRPNDVDRKTEDGKSKRQ
jgi:hypothetical protein